MSKQSFTTGQVLTAAQVNSLQANDYNQSVSVKTASYTLAAADKGTRIEFNTSGSVTCTVNSGLFDAGDTLVIQNRGAGAATVTAGTATVNTSASLVVKQYDSGVLYFVSDSSAIYFASDAADTPLTTKGDLFTFSTAADRLAVGNPGETLVADSSASTGLRWQGNFAAAKNKFINGDFTINQRSFSSQVNGTGTFGFDRWKMNGIDGTTTFSAQVFTPGTAPVSGYEGINYLRIVTTGQTATNAESDFFQPIEDVRTFAGQTITLSFWAKANSGTPKVSAELRQNFGSGGSSVVSTPVGFKTISTSWERYSLTIAVPSVSGKTIGTGSALNVVFFVSAGTDLNTRASSIGIQTNTFELWGVQAEAGSVATAFQTATGTLAGELAACQRYCINYPADGAYNRYGGGLNYSTTKCNANIPLPVEMRTTPSLTTTGTASNYAVNHGADTVTACSAVPAINGAGNSKKVASVDATVSSGLTAGSFGVLLSNNNTTSYLLFTAEL